MSTCETPSHVFRASIEGESIVSSTAGTQRRPTPYGRVLAAEAPREGVRP